MRVPYLFVAALDALRIPSVSFGHPPKGSRRVSRSDRWPGSRHAPDLVGTQAETPGHVCALAAAQAQRARAIAGVLLTFEYRSDSRLCDVVRPTMTRARGT